ncbi:unnamed protein product [Meloidogyne enterolobii]|uniref:Uncharacterized protein n=1 Tax=Meloidogyne enterolobii TaxID=390850 RepID=A0ACB0XY72_MELEN
MIFITFLYLNLFIIFIFLITKICNGIMLCEVQGTCLKCPDGHISHFICRNNEDCFREEYCYLKRGFCCLNKNTSTNSKIILNKCPDGSRFGKLCKIDVDCLFKDEICIEGKCCPSCRQRRLLALRELRSIGISFFNKEEKENKKEEFIPQCNDDGKYFRPMQCVAHSGECFCVDKFGRKNIKNNLLKENILVNCSIIREKQEEINKEENKLISSTKIALNKDKEIINNNCTDPLREFRLFLNLNFKIKKIIKDNCGSICPISCFSKNNLFKCPQQEQCMKGCFCRLPFVLLDYSKPFNSPCVLPSECPLLSFTSDLNKWNNGGFFPSFTPTTTKTNKINKNNKCKDSFKNYQNCGSACPTGCGRLLLPSNNNFEDEDNNSCSSNCVPGCFCRIPYVLRDPNDLNSECILPKFCPLQQFALQIPQQISSNNSSIKEEILQKNSTTQLVVKRNGESEREKCENDLTKEFLKCGSSCPLGCDQLNRPFRFCSPCISGCFCKNGYIFVNSSEWEISECILPLNCPPPQLFNITKLTAIQEKENCGEALAIANLYNKEGKRIGKLIVKPERNGEFGGGEGEINTRK